MRTDYLDAMMEIPPDNRIVRKGPTTRRLIARFRGTFCFDFGNGFRCGSSYSLQFGQELKLKQTFAVPQAGLGFSVSTKSTVSQEWSHTAGACETCLPIACHTNSLISEWSHETNLGIYRHTSRKTDFQPSSRLVIDPNCNFSADCPGCSDTDYRISSTQPSAVADSVSSAVIEAVGLEQITAESIADESAVQTASAIVDGYGEPADSGESEVSVVVVRQNTGDVELTTEDSEFDVALLSIDATDRARGGIRIRPNGTIPIFIAARALDNPTAWAELTGADDEYVAKLDRIAVVVGRFTVGWEILTIPESAADIGSLTLRVHLRGSNTDHIASVTAPVIA